MAALCRQNFDKNVAFKVLFDVHVGWKRFNIDFCNFNFKHRTDRNTNFEKYYILGLRPTDMQHLYCKMILASFEGQVGSLMRQEIHTRPNTYLLGQFILQD